MYNTDKEYNLTAFEEMDKAEREERIKEMAKAEERLENARRRKKTTLFCSIAGFAVGVLYIIYVALGVEWVAELFNNIANGNSTILFLLDFLPPLLVSGILSYFIARKEKGAFSYILTSMFVTMIVILVFFVYLSLMTM